MNDTIKLLNLKDDDVEEATSIIKNNIYFANIKLKRHEEHCPNCDSTLNTIDSYKIKQINHPILTNMQVIIKYKCRRYKCLSCGKTFNETNPFVFKGKRYTSYQTIYALNLLRNPEMTFTQVAKLCNISVTTVQHIFDTHCEYTRLKLPRVLCIDEYYDPGTGIGKYDCLLLDFETNKVVDVLPDRSKWHLIKYLQGRTEKDKESVEFVSIDMWETYRDVAQHYLKKAKICVDSFHVIKNIQESLRKVRIRIMNKYEHDTYQYYLLKKFNFLLHKTHCDIPNNNPQYNNVLKKEANLRDILHMIIAIDDELEAAYFLKENYVEFNKVATINNAEELLDNQIENIYRSNLPEFENIYKMLINWRQEIVNSFNLVKNKERINNSIIESRNSIIKKIIRNSNGVKNFHRLKLRIMYCINKQSYNIVEHKNIIKQKGKPRGKYNKNKEEK